MSGRAARRADLGQPARGAQPRPGRLDRLPHHHDDARPARQARAARQGSRRSSRSRPCRCSIATRVRRLHALSCACERALITGGAGFIGSTLADRLLADGVEVVDLRQLPHRAPRVHRRRAARGDDVEFVRATCSTTTLLPTVARGLRHGLPPRGQRRRAPRTRAPAARSRAEHDRHLQRARGDARRRRARASRFSSTGSVYGEPDVFPTPEDVPVPGPDLALRRLEARRRRADRRLRARLRLHRARSSASSRSSASATRTATSSTSSARCGPTRRACACSATAARRSRYLYVRTAWRRCSPRVAQHGDEPGAVTSTTSAPTRPIVVDDSIATITAHLGVTPRARVHRRRPRLARRQPADPPRHRADPRARLGADADHPRRDRAHGRLVRAEPGIVLDQEPSPS